VRRIGFDGVDWIRGTQDRDRWRTVVHTVMNIFGFHERRRISRLAERTVNFSVLHEGPACRQVL
jgi:hypothetical protein